MAIGIMSAEDKITSAQQSFSFTRRTMFIGAVQGGIGLLLAGRMAFIAVAENKKYTLKSESNRVNLTLIPPRRGWFIDRFGKPIATNRADFRVDIIPDRLVDKDATINTLTQLLALTPDDLERINREIKQSNGFQPVQIADGLDYESFARVSVRLPDLPGVSPRQGFSRYYPSGAAVGHLVGYVGSVSAEEYAKNKDPLLITPGFKIGKEGLEKTFEASLQGKAGAKRVEVTAHGKIVRELTTRSDIPGKPVQLTIDVGLQNYASRRIGDASGSCVVIDCTNGDILAMASMPCYDPNRFSDGISHNEWAMFSHDDHLPLINKSINGLYPPGSTSKPMTALALLRAGIDPNQTVTCAGAYKVGNSAFHCSGGPHGPIAMHEAIIKSCDIYFYHMGKTAGIEAIAPMARYLGLGQKFDLPLTSQRYGTIPDPAWLQRRYHREWSIFDTINASIGQGYVLANPLQLALMTARIASGKLLHPQLLLHGKRPPIQDLVNDPQQLAFVRDAMSGVVNSGRGTASVAHLPVDGVKLAGKTGTAQVRRISMAERSSGVRSNSSLAWKQRDHSLFIGFAPAEAPRYAAACIIEHGGFGASAAAPLIRDTMTYLFAPDKAMATLEQFERGIGGDIDTRMAAERARWKSNYSAPSTDNPATPTDTPPAKDTTKAAAKISADKSVPSDLPDPPTPIATTPAAPTTAPAPAPTPAPLPATGNTP